MYDPEEFDFEIGYVLTGIAPKTVRLSGKHLLTLRELPAVEKMATLVHVGQVSDIHRTYGTLGMWVERNRWQMIGAGRQIMTQRPTAGKDDIVTELQVPVSKASEKIGS